MQYFYGLQRINKYMHKNYGAKFVQNDKLNNKTKKVAEKYWQNAHTNLLCNCETDFKMAMYWYGIVNISVGFRQNSGDPAGSLGMVFRVRPIKEEKDEKESCGIDDECCYGFLAGSLRR